MARIYYALDFSEVVFIDENLYFIAGAGIFVILAIMCVKIYERFSANQNSDSSPNIRVKAKNAPLSYLVQNRFGFI